MHTLTANEKAESIVAASKLAHYVVDNGTRLVPLDFSNAKLALENYANIVDCDLIAITQNIVGHCDILTRNDTVVCYIASFNYISRIANYGDLDFVAGDSFVADMRASDSVVADMCCVGTYSSEELQNL